MQQNSGCGDASPTDGIARDSRKYVDESLLQRIQAFEPVIEDANEVGFYYFFKKNFSLEWVSDY